MEGTGGVTPYAQEARSLGVVVSCEWGEAKADVENGEGEGEGESREAGGCRVRALWSAQSAPGESLQGTRDACSGIQRGAGR